MRYTWPLLLLLCSGFVPVQGQTPQTVLRQWYAAQREAEAVYTFLEVKESTQLRVEGPSGKMETRMVAQISGVPGTMDVERSIEQMFFNNRPVPQAKFETEEQRRYHMVGVGLRAFMQSALFPQRLLARMRPISPIQREQIDGTLYWRFEMEPRREMRAVERLTVWFAPDDLRLHQIRLVLNRRHNNQPLVVTTTYTRLNSLDLPASRITEGTTRRKRRGKLFTHLFEMRVTFSDYHLTSE